MSRATPASEMTIAAETGPLTCSHAPFVVLESSKQQQPMMCLAVFRKRAVNSSFSLMSLSMAVHAEFSSCATTLEGLEEATGSGGGVSIPGQPFLSTQPLYIISIGQLKFGSPVDHRGGADQSTETVLMPISLPLHVAVSQGQ